jgi:predicted permease
VEHNTYVINNSSYISLILLSLLLHLLFLRFFLSNNNNNNNNISVLLSAWGSSLMHITFQLLGEKCLRQTTREAETDNFVPI